jgi:hypothetical protein
MRSIVEFNINIVNYLQIVKIYECRANVGLKPLQLRMMSF